MNESLPDLIYNGIFLCLSIQLVVIGLLKIISKSKRPVILGLFCLFLGTVFIYDLYWNFFKTIPFYSILLANYKSFFFAPLLYLYIALLREENIHKRLLYFHLTLPVTIFLSYSFLKHITEEFYAEHFQEIVTFISILSFLVYSFYLIKGISLQTQVKPILKTKIFRRYFIFYYIVLIHFWITDIYALLTTFIDLEAQYLGLSRYLFMPLAFLIYCLVILFAIIESKKFKTFFLGQTLHVDRDILEGKAIINKRVQVQFYEQKIYKNPDLKIAGAANKIGVSNKVLTEFIKNEYEMSFIDFINDLRVKEFKTLLNSPKSKPFNLMGIASQSGFKSKATFYRVFKNKEGITPNEYLKSL